MIKSKLLKKFLLLVVFLFALFLRIYKLEQVPPGANWDEAALGYTGYSILKTGKDEWGVRFPLFTKQFGEYKSAFYPYFAAISIKFFDLNIFAARLPSAVAGALSVIIFYFLVRELFLPPIPQPRRLKKKPPRFSLAAIASILLAISPWHLHFSRYALSAQLAMTFALAGLTLLFAFLRRKKHWLLYLSILSSALAIYTYHSFRIVLPLIYFFIIITSKKVFLENKRNFFVFTIFALLLFFPLINAYRQGFLTVRASEVSLFSDQKFQERQELLLKENVQARVRGISFLNNKWILSIEQIIRNELAHFSSNFLFLGKDANLRYGTGWFGKFYYFEALLMIIGLIYIVKKDKKLAFFLIFWALIAPVPAVLSNESPHPIRAYFLLPVLLIFASLGIFHLVFQFKNKLKKSLVFGLTSFVYLLSLAFYLNYYYIHFPKRAEMDWQSFYKPLVEYLATLDQKKYREILFSNNFNQPHIFLFFYQKINPQRVQEVLAKGKTASIMNSAIDVFENYRFTPIIWHEYAGNENTLIIDNNLHKEQKKEFNIYGVELLKSFYFQDKKHAFSVYETRSAK